jgi:hypothetical protein
VTPGVTDGVDGAGSGVGFCAGIALRSSAQASPAAARSKHRASGVVCDPPARGPSVTRDTCA